MKKLLLLLIVSLYGCSNDSEYVYIANGRYICEDISHGSSTHLYDCTDTLLNLKIDTIYNATNVIKHKRITL